MIRNPIGLRLASGPAAQPLRVQVQEAAALGARGVVLEALGDLAPHRLGETGRRALRHLLRSAELSLIALALPTRRPFDSSEQLEDRLRRADAAFALAFELGTNLVLAHVGGVPPADDAVRLETFTNALRELGARADHRGVRLALETGAGPGSALSAFLDALAVPTLAASIDPAALLRSGIDPVIATRELAGWVAHAYADDAAEGPAGGGGAVPANPRGLGFPPGVLDWEEYLGALEEIAYHGHLTVWPAPGASAAARFSTIVRRLNALG